MLPAAFLSLNLNSHIPNSEELKFVPWRRPYQLKLDWCKLKQQIKEWYDFWMIWLRYSSYIWRVSTTRSVLSGGRKWLCTVKLHPRQCLHLTSKQGVAHIFNNCIFVFVCVNRPLPSTWLKRSYGFYTRAPQHKERSEFPRFPGSPQ